MAGGGCRGRDRRDRGDRPVVRLICGVDGPLVLWLVPYADADADEEEDAPLDDVSDASEASEVVEVVEPVEVEATEDAVSLRFRVLVVRALSLDCMSEARKVRVSGEYRGLIIVEWPPFTFPFDGMTTGAVEDDDASVVSFSSARGRGRRDGRPGMREGAMGKRRCRVRLPAAG